MSASAIFDLACPCSCLSRGKKRRAPKHGPTAFTHRKHACLVAPRAITSAETPLANKKLVNGCKATIRLEKVLGVLGLAVVKANAKLLAGKCDCFVLGRKNAMIDVMVVGTSMTKVIARRNVTTITMQVLRKVDSKVLLVADLLVHSSSREDPWSRERIEVLDIAKKTARELICIGL